MERYDLSWIKVIGVGTTGASALTYFSDVADDVFPKRLIVFDKDDVASLQEKISAVGWLFMITDIDDLELATQVAECIEELKKLPTASSITITSFSAPPKLIYGESEFPTITFNPEDLISEEVKLPLVTFLILCPSAEDARLADIPESFGTWIILPEDKIAECDLTKNVIIYRTVYMVLSTIWDGLIGMDFADVTATLSNFGKACVGFGESLDAENNSPKRATGSPRIYA